MAMKETVTGPPPVRTGPDLIDTMIDVMRPAIDGMLKVRERR